MNTPPSFEAPDAEVASAIAPELRVARMASWLKFWLSVAALAALALSAMQQLRMDTSAPKATTTPSNLPGSPTAHAQTTVSR